VVIKINNAPNCGDVPNNEGAMNRVSVGVGGTGDYANSGNMEFGEFCTAVVQIPFV